MTAAPAAMGEESRHARVLLTVTRQIFTLEKRVRNPLALRWKLPLRAGLPKGAGGRLTARRGRKGVVRGSDSKRRPLIAGPNAGQPVHPKEERMKKAAVAVLTMIFGLSLAAGAMADTATKDECVAKTKEAAAMVAAKGLEETIKEVNNKQGKFVWKDTYVFMMDLDGKMLAHPMSPALIGQNLLDRKDKGEPGKLLFKEFVELAKTKGEGWSDYMWANPGDPKPRKKISFIYRVPGKDLLVGAGIWE